MADVLVINATAPFLTAALAWAWTGERERWTTLAASLVALLGVVVTVGRRLLPATCSAISWRFS